MRLTIIPSDGAVYENSVGYTGLSWEGTDSDVHAIQWFDTNGWIEYNDGKPNQTIDSLPQWVSNAINAWTVANTPVPPVPPTAEENKSTAVQKLTETDWATIPDVSDSTKSNPYLGNVGEFLTYRNSIRQSAINPVAGNIDWPVKPEAVWTTL